MSMALEEIGVELEKVRGQLTGQSKELDAVAGQLRRLDMQEPNESGFRLWLCAKGYQPRPINDAVSRCHRVERHYGDLDALYRQDRLADLLENLVCTPSGECRHHIPFLPGADPIKGTASLKTAIKRYQEYRDSIPITST